MRVETGIISKRKTIKGMMKNMGKILSENIKIKLTLILGCLIAGTIIFSLSLYMAKAKIDGFGKEVNRYKSQEDINVTHTSKSVVAKIEIIDEYTKDGEKYFELRTSVTGDEIFTYSEREYDKIFGLGNDALLK